MYTTLEPLAITHAGDILVVDDMPDNLRLITTVLTEHKYRVRRVVNGLQAIEVVLLEPPELILLDILMPGMSGYEVCERLKHNPQTAEIPIIFLSALNDQFDKARGFSLGGADYITKPFQLREVLARVDHQITISRQQRTLQKRERQLAELNQQLAERLENRTETIERLLQQLNQQVEERLKIEAAAQAQNAKINQVKTRMLEQISHELRTPLAIISLSVESLTHNQLLPEQKQHRLNQIRANVERLNQALENFAALKLTKHPDYTRNLKQINLDHFLAAQVNTWQAKAGKNFEIIHLSQGINQVVRVDQLLLEEILEQVISNSIRFSPEGGRVEISYQILTDQIEITVQDWGIGIPIAEQDQVFEEFYRATNADVIPSTPGVGIGLAIAKQLINFQGGKIQIVSRPAPEPDHGTTIQLTFPYVAP
ncbi:MAG: hybrid sensor histidine kinase/response regulator [Pseudanabaenaceae cyanobacterium bins.68]|nr:hybrid sensor histidine kinase/response regulator [Pseudanabaenaceae cyanobacterium bins.68]